MIEFSEPPGATPIEDTSGLMLTHITTKAQLNQAEALNIVAAEEWISDPRARIASVFTPELYRDLHRRMLDTVWDWAGNFRTHNPSIGVPWPEIPERLLNAGRDFATQFASGRPFIEFMAEYHHRLVFIHPFPNGNGRWARLAADAVATLCFKQRPVVWSRGNLLEGSDERDAYIAALRAADEGDPGPLISYLRTLNR